MMACSKAWPERGEAAPVRQPVGHHRHDDAGKDADEADQGPQADDGKSALPERERIHDAGEQHLLGDRHDAERDARQHHPDGLARARRRASTGARL